MLSYQSIINVSDGTVIYNGPWGGACSGSTASFTFSPSVPASVDRLYEPQSVIQWKTPSDSESFSQIKKSGLIKMTPYSVGKVVTDNYLISHNGASSSLGWPRCSDSSDPWIGDQIKAISTWTEQFDLSICSHPIFGTATDTDTVFRRARNEAMSKCVNDSAQTLDALTTFAEAPRAISSILSALKAVKRPLTSFRSFREEFRRNPKGKSLSSVTDAWLRYRYEIMPNVYTVQDSLQLLAEKGAIFKTSRSKSIVPAGTTLSGVPETGRWVEYFRTGSTTFRCTGKAKYDGSFSRVFDQSSINPFLTGWELVPYSFVVDWFINVGDVILSRSAFLHDAAISRMFCISTKTDTTETWFHCQNEVHQNSKYYSFPGDTVEVTIPLVARSLARKKVTNSYDRVLFKPSDVGLSWNPELNTLRSLDLMALSARPILDALRKLRK